MPEHCRSEHAALYSTTASDAVQGLHEQLLEPSGDDADLCRATQHVLNHHPAALMAPITETVEQNGRVEEMASPNPTRLLLFRTLQRKLCKDKDASSCYWDCLLQALQVTRNIEGTRKHANGMFCDVPVAWMLQHGTVRLDLFWTYLQRHPETSRAFVNVLLFYKDDNTITVSCECQPASGFLHCIHQETSSGAASILTLAIQHWPLTLWLKQDGSFAQRLLQGLESAISVTYCCLRRDSHSQSILSIVQALLRHIPFQEKLRIPTMTLIDSITVSISDNNEARTIFLDLCGGQVTPQGYETPMSPFVSAWLGTLSGIQWFKNLLRQHQVKGEPICRRNTTTQVLCTILRSKFSMIGENEELWQLFQETFQASQGETRGYELMEAMLKGRHSEKSFLRKIPSAWWNQFATGLAGDGSIAATVCSCCGYLRAEDWTERDDFDSILDAIVSVCTNHRASVKWRSASLKALGDVCSNLFTDSKAFMSQQNSILDAAMTTINDSNANVRCMSLFVVGNLSLALRACKAVLQSAPLWITVASQCLAKAKDDANEKVINNAIRSIGQIAALFVAQPMLDQLISHVNDIVDVLRSRIQMSLPNNNRAEVLSWKQRAARKRQCWGACNSMTIIFQSLGQTVFDCSGVLETLVKVLKEGVNEKVVISASKAIRSFNTSLQVNLVPALQACTRTLERVDVSSRLKEEMDLLMVVLLRNITRADATCWMLNLQDSKDNVLRWIFSWMVSHSIPSECFLVLSDAMNRSGIQVDFRIEQMFATAVRNSYDDDGDEL